jgi:predicted N-acetyltransferase YhbS
MTFDIRPLGDAWDQLVSIIELSFGSTWPAEEHEPERQRFEPERAIAAHDGDEMVGHACAYSFTMTVPGGMLGVAGVSMVGVLPTFRRRGVLTTLMRHQLQALYEMQGEPVAVLGASEPAIYPRFGYGLAADAVRVEIPRDHSALRPVPGIDDVTLRYADPEKALDTCGALHEAVVPTRPGMIQHTEPWRRGQIDDPPANRNGASQLRCVIAERAGLPTGFAYFRTRGSWEPRGPNGTTVVERVHSGDQASYAALWRFLLDQDLMSLTTHRRLPADDPLLSLLLDIRQAHVGVRDGM